MTDLPDNKQSADIVLVMLRTLGDRYEKYSTSIASGSVWCADTMKYHAALNTFFIQDETEIKIEE